MSPEIVMCVTGRFQRLNPLLADTCVGTAENCGLPPPTVRSILCGHRRPRAVRASAARLAGTPRPRLATGRRRCQEPALRPNSPGMAVAAIDCAYVAQVYRMFEGRSFNSRGLRAALLLAENGVADSAILANHLPVRAHVLSVVAAKAAGKIEMPDVIRVGLPVNLHLRKSRGAI